MLRTASGKVELGPPAAARRERAARAALVTPSAGPRARSGAATCAPTTPGCTTCPSLPRQGALHRRLNPRDAERLGLAEGGDAAVQLHAPASSSVPIEVTDSIMEGVVSIPHGWGHDAEGSRLEVAEERPGVNSNLLSDDQLVDALSGNAVLNGIPVTLTPA